MSLLASTYLFPEHLGELGIRLPRYAVSYFIPFDLGMFNKTMFR